MRLLTALALTLELLFPASAVAGKCDTQCAQQRAKPCKQRCEADCKNGKQECSICVNACENDMRLCPEMCALMMRNKGNPARMKQELQQLQTRAVPETKSQH